MKYEYSVDVKLHFSNRHTKCQVREKKTNFFSTFALKRIIQRFSNRIFHTYIVKLTYLTNIIPDSFKVHPYPL